MWWYVDSTSVARRSTYVAYYPCATSKKRMSTKLGCPGKICSGSGFLTGDHVGVCLPAAKPFVNPGDAPRKNHPSEDARPDFVPTARAIALQQGTTVARRPGGGFQFFGGSTSYVACS